MTRLIPKAMTDKMVADLEDTCDSIQRWAGDSTELDKARALLRDAKAMQARLDAEDIG